MDCDVPKVDVQIVDVASPFPCLFDVPKPHRQMEPVKDVGDRLTCCAEHDALKANVSVAENGDIAARQPSLCPQRRANNVVLASRNIRRGGELARWSAFGHNTAHGDLEMAALMAGNSADVGAINENGNGRAAGPADAIRTCYVPLFDLIGDLGEPVADGTMIVRA